MASITTKEIYELRFKNMLKFRRAMWRVLCSNYFQRWIPQESSVVEIAAGYCEFINSIRAKSKYAVDINRDTREHADADVKVLIGKSTDLKAIKSNTIDRVFISNFFEHITKPEIIKTLQEVRRILKPRGCVLILQPNIRFTATDYWMFFDHITPLDDRAITEVLLLLGFKIEKCIPRFLPFTAQSSLPKSLFLLKLYLKLPFVWRFFGGQAFIVAVRDSE